MVLIKDEKVFDDQICNTERIFELDVEKAVIALQLAIIHVFVECSPDEILDARGLPYFFDSIAGGPFAAPMFMFAMGIGLQFISEHVDRYLLRRGIKLLALAFGLNVCRYLVPSLIGFALTKDAEFYLQPLPYLFFGNDILFFAGLASLLMALFQHFHMSRRMILAAGALLSLIGTPFNGLDTGNQALNVLLGHFVGVEDAAGEVYSDFPLLLWFFSYASGYVCAYYLRRLRNKNQFYKLVTPVCLGLSVVVMTVESVNGFGMMGENGANVFYHMLLPEAFVCVCCSLGMMGLYHLMFRNAGHRFRHAVIVVSRSLTTIYVIQWTLVWWSVDLIVYVMRGSKWIDPLPALLLGVVLSAASALLAGLWQSIRHRRGAA